MFFPRSNVLYSTETFLNIIVTLINKNNNWKWHIHRIDMVLDNSVEGPSSRHQRLRSSVGVSYYFHYPKDFLKLYGRFSMPVDPHTLDQKLSSTNCEMMNRPDLAMSEYCDTVLSNMAFLQTFVEMGCHVERLLERLGRIRLDMEIWNNATPAEEDRK